MKTIKSSLLAGLGIAVLGLSALPAQAETAQTSTVQSADALTVVRDPVTGELRAATGEEQAALQQKANAGKRLRQSAAPQAQQKFHASGARGARVTDEFLSSSVVTRLPDGSMQKQCFDSHDAADSAAQAGHVHVTPQIATE
ncbi:post-PEP-CTERM-1 domain-containing protein [Massilia sp. NR 4-1]|uniref:post-PEP-CTERM-1 domain-containing protein n=1 Tax=Massilia sp. NR 4-1 TaxID=1678028 RepID=UPI00067D2B48|nr:hypothetical protein [Massilia sp. NR 4-1]AKU23363.1 hypothetical protein ACZ75_19770 [Massilia sp. NR 4-1]